MTKKDFLHTPITQVDLEKMKTIEDLIDAYKGASFQARNLGTCAQIWENMLTDKERPTIVMGLAGSLMAAGLRKVLRDIIKYNLVDVIVTVGSQPYQDIYAARGYDFWRSSPDVDDLELREHFLDRLYDTIVDEEKFRETDEYLGKLFGKLETRGYSSREILKFFGEQLDDEASWVAEAARTNTPIFAPALNDSSIGIGMVSQYVKARKRGEAYPTIDPIRDAYELSQIKYTSKKTGVIYIAGGISKNYIQQTEVISEVLGYEPGGHHYAIQLTMDSPHWGGLSGCTFEEAQSWGKIAKDAKKAQCYVDVSLGLPMIVGALMAKRKAWAGRKRLTMKYEGDTLKKL